MAVPQLVSLFQKFYLVSIMTHYSCCPGSPNPSYFRWLLRLRLPLPLPPLAPLKGINARRHLYPKMTPLMQTRKQKRSNVIQTNALSLYPRTRCCFLCQAVPCHASPPIHFFPEAFNRHAHESNKQPPISRIVAAQL